MKSGLALVLTVLRDQPLPAEPDWPAALHAAEAEHLLPYFVSRVRHACPQPAPELNALLTAAEREAALQAFWWTSELRGLLQAFTAAGLPVLPLKGPSLALRVYGGIALRPCRDLDLLVQAADFPRATALLATLGFTPAARPDDYHQGFHRGTTAVEIHFDVENPLAFNFDTTAAWSRAQPATFLGEPTLQLAPTDELLYLALHGVRHRFARLNYILDIALAQDRLTLPPTLQLEGHARTLASLLTLAQQLARKLDHPATRTLIVPTAPRTERHLQALADRLWTTVLAEPERAMDWQEQHRFFRELEPNPLARMLRNGSHLRILATRLIDSDYDQAARFGVSHPALVWLVRHLRLLTRRHTD